jgi:hypothetical protein
MSNRVIGASGHQKKKPMPRAVLIFNYSTLRRVYPSPDSLVNASSSFALRISSFLSASRHCLGRRLLLVHSSTPRCSALLRPFIRPLVILRGRSCLLAPKNPHEVHQLEDP